MSNAYKTLTAEDLSFLQSICGSDRTIPGSEVGEDFCHDELSGKLFRPEVLIRPVSTDEVSQIMRYASRERISVTARGQGTGLVGACVPIHGGILLDMSRMNRILELDESNLTVTVEPGVLLMEVAQYVEQNNLFYPPDPGEKTATIGGNISTNAGGMRAVKYGVTRDYVRGLEVVLPSGDVVELGGQTAKNSSGYSLKDLVVGSEGTLAIITKAVLRLLPLPQFKISLLIPFPDIESAIAAVPVVIKESSIPTAVEFMQREVIEASEQFLNRPFPDHSSDAYLLLTFDGASQQEIDLAYRAVAEKCLSIGAIDVFISNTPERNESIWSSRGAFLEAIKASTTEMDECDVVVPRRRFGEFVLFAHTLEGRFNIRIRLFGHAGDGNLHIYICKDNLDQATWERRLAEVFDALYSKARELNGQVSGEHGIGSAKKGFLKKSLAPEVLNLMRGIKAVFDPQNILNPDKVIR